MLETGPENDQRADVADQRLSRILLGAFTTVGLVAVLGGLIAAGRIESQIDSQWEFHTPALFAIQQIQPQLKQTFQEVFEYLASGNAGDKREFRELAAVFETDALRFREIARLEDPGEEVERRLFDGIQAEVRELFGRSEEIFADYEEEGLAAVQGLEEYEAGVDRVNAAVALLVRTEEQELDQEHAVVLALIENAVRTFIGMGLLTLAVALVLGRTISRTTARHGAAIRQAEDERYRLALQTEQSQRLESLGLIASGVAHDFNNLLVGILGNVEIAIAHIDDPVGAREALGDIRAAGEQGAELTRSMMASAGTTNPEIEPVDVSELMTESVRVLRLQLPETARCELEIGDAGLWVAGDSARLRQIAMNLVINAAEALDGRPGSIRIRTGVQERADGTEAVLPVPHAGSYVFIEVADSGGGMRPEILERIFDPFYTTKVNGRGLGLAAMLGIVRTHEGGVEVESQQGRGSSFRVLLPRIPAPSRSAPAPVPNREWPPGGGGNVLVIDDDPLVARATARMLKAEGITVRTAGGGLEAIEIVKKSSNDLDAIVLDLRMPEMDGRKTFPLLREIRPELPVVFYSGDIAAEDDELITGSPNTALLQKPFTIELLMAKLSEAGL